MLSLCLAIVSLNSGTGIKAAWQVWLSSGIQGEPCTKEKIKALECLEVTFALCRGLYLLV